MLNKILLIASISLLFIITPVKPCLEVAFNTKNFMLLENLDLTPYLADVPLIKEKVTIEQTGLTIILNKLSFKEFILPKKVEFNNVVTRDHKGFVHVKFFDISIKLIGEVKFITIKDFEVDSTKPIIINVSRLEFQLSFNEEGKLIVQNLSLEVKSIDVSLTSRLPNFFLGAAKSLIISKINSSNNEISGLIQENLNKIFSAKQIAEFDLFNSKVKLDLTPNKPDFIFPAKVKNTKALSFLELQAGEPNLYLVGGLNAEFYIENDFVAIPEEKQIRINEKNTNKDISILVTDYSINSFLRTLQKSGGLNYDFGPHNDIDLQFTYDTERSLKNFIPEITETIKENREAKITVSLPSNMKPPTVVTNDQGQHLDTELFVNLFIKDNDGAFTQIFSAIVDVQLQSRLVFINNMLNIEIGESFIKNFNIMSNTIALQYPNEVYAENINTFVKKALEISKPKLSNIDLFGYIHSLAPIPVNFKNVDVVYNNGFTSVGFNAVRK